MAENIIPEHAHGSPTDAKLEIGDAPEYFDQASFMRDELTNDLIDAGVHVAQAQRIGDIHRGLYCIDGLAALARRFAVESQFVADGENDVTCVSPRMSDILAKSVELLAVHLAEQTADFTRTLIEDEKKRMMRAGSDFDVRR